MNLRRSASALALALLLASATAGAQVSDFDRNTARTLGQEAHAALDQRDFATAADRFARADALVHAPTFLLGLAQAQVGLGKLVSALENYNRILREGLPPSPPAPFVKAVETARTEADALAARIPHVVVQVTGPSAATAKVTIDGQAVPAAALGVKRAIDPGKHVVRAEAPGPAAAETTVMIAEGKTETVTLEPRPGGAAPPATPPPPDAAPPAAAPTSGAAPPPASSGSSPRRVLGIVGMAAGGAGLALGAVMGGVVIAKHGSLSSSCPSGHCPIKDESTLKPQVDSYYTFSTVSTAGFVAGGVLAAAGIVLFVTAPKPDAARAGTGLVVEPMIGAGWAGARGSF